MTHSERRMERLDEFFLFITSVFGLFFSFLYSLTGYREVVYGFLPLLIIGLVIPIYIGYVRGAILLDTLEERVRGWIYFIIGVVYYVALVVFLVVNRLLLSLNVEFDTFSAFLSFASILLFSYFLGWRRLYRWFCRNIFNALDHRMTELTDKIYADTSSCAFFTGLFFYIAFNLSISENLDVSIALVMIFFVFMGVLLFILYERDIRKWVNLVRFSDFIEIESTRARPYIPIKVGKIAFLIYIVLIGILSLLWKMLPLVVTIGLVTIVLFTLTLLNLLTEKKYVPVVKKNVPKEVGSELTELIDRITQKKEKGKRQEND